MADFSPHVSFAVSLLSRPLPFSAVAHEDKRVALLYFSLLSLDVCGALPATLSASQRGSILSWLHACVAPGGAAFCGSPDYSSAPSVAMTYAGVASLVLLRDAGAALDRGAISRGLAAAQRPDGALDSTALAGDGDVRFVFAGAAVAALLQLPVAGTCGAALDGEAAARFLTACQTYEGGFSLSPGGEAHGAATYCALAGAAALARAAAGDARVAAMLGRLDTRAAARWLCLRKDALGAPTGRAGKDADACYAFWLAGAYDALRALDGGVSEEAVPPLLAEGGLAWVRGCAGARGAGFAREHGEMPDPFHTAYALAGLALAQTPGLRAVDAVLGVTRDSMDAWVPVLTKTGSVAAPNP